MKALSEIKVGILGFGNLGGLIGERLLNMGLPPKNIYVVKRPSNQERVARLGLVAIQPPGLLETDMIIVATKADQFEDAWHSAKLQLRPKQLVISCMAKVALARLVELCGTQNVARLMTTTPCVLGKGLGAWIAAEGMIEEQKNQAKLIIDGLGHHLMTDREQDLAFATVLSSINGVVFDLIHAFEQALNFIGAPKRYQHMVLLVLESAIAYRRHRAEMHPVGLADEVSSPAGTTVAMRHILNRAGFAAALTDAVAAAFERTKG